MTGVRLGLVPSASKSREISSILAMDSTPRSSPQTMDAPSGLNWVECDTTVLSAPSGIGNSGRSTSNSISDVWIPSTIVGRNRRSSPVLVTQRVSELTLIALGCGRNIRPSASRVSRTSGVPSDISNHSPLESTLGVSQSNGDTCPFGKRAGRVGDISRRLTGDDDAHEVLLCRSPGPPTTSPRMARRPVWAASTPSRDLGCRRCPCSTASALLRSPYLGPELSQAPAMDEPSKV